MKEVQPSSSPKQAGRSDPRPTWVRWQIVWLMLAYSFMSWFNRVSMSVAGDEVIMKQYGLSTTQMGWVYSAFLLAYAVWMTPGGWYIDRHGAWRALVVMGIGSALFGAGTGLVGFFVASTTALWLYLLIVRSIMGLFTAPIYPASGRMIAQWLPFQQRALANGLVSGAALVGIASTFVVFGTLIEWFRWPTAFLITSAATGLLAVVWLAYARERPDQHFAVNEAELQLIRGHESDWPKPQKEMANRFDWKALLRNRSLVLLTLNYAAVGYFEYLFFFWMHYYFENQLNLGTERSRLYATLLYLAMAAGMWLGGQLSDRLIRSWGYRLGRALVPVAGMLGGALFLGLGLIASEPREILIYFALALASLGACEGPCWATAIELGGPKGGTSAGIFNTGGNVGGMIAPIITPWVSNLWGWQWGISLGSFVLLFGVVLWLWIDPRERVSE